MSYEFDGDNLLSCEQIASDLYNMLLDENGNFLSCSVNSNNELDSVYLGVGKNDCYYYRQYLVRKTASGSINKYSVSVSFYRTPFAINDEIIRPYFTTKRDFSNTICPLVLGMQSYKDDWRFNTNRYGDKTNNIDKSKFDNTDYVISYCGMGQNYGKPATIDISTSGISKSSKITNYYNSNLKLK